MATPKGAAWRRARDVTEGLRAGRSCAIGELPPDVERAVEIILEERDKRQRELDDKARKDAERKR